MICGKITVRQLCDNCFEKAFGFNINLLDSDLCRPVVSIEKNKCCVSLPQHYGEALLGCGHLTIVYNNSDYAHRAICGDDLIIETTEYKFTEQYKVCEHKVSVFHCEFCGSNVKLVKNKVELAFSCSLNDCHAEAESCNDKLRCVDHFFCAFCSFERSAR